MSLLRVRRLRPRLRILVLLLAYASGCGSESANVTTGPESGKTSVQASVYLQQLLNIMQASSVSRLTIDWNVFRANVVAAASNAQTIPDTYAAIKLALGQLGDGHSSYTGTTGTVLFVSAHTCTSSGADAPTLSSNIGYVRVGAFSGSASLATAYANSIHAAIRAADRPDLIGWVVDLRGNTGGNMWPMVAGLGPILGDGVLGYFVEPGGASSRWEYHDGASWLDGGSIQRVDQPYVLLRANPRVAVLSDKGIASSGEATLIAFRGRANARVFGSATCGLSTANQSYTLSDGATLVLTTAVMADRARKVYGDAVQPDEAFATQMEAVQRAVAWLQGVER